MGDFFPGQVLFLVFQETSSTRESLPLEEFLALNEMGPAWALSEARRKNTASRNDSLARIHTIFFFHQGPVEG